MSGQPADYWESNHDVRIRTIGYHLQVWIDGTSVADTYNDCLSTYNPANSTGTVQGGFIGYWGASWHVNSISVTPLVATVPEPGSIVALLSGMVGLVGFARRRRA